MQVTKVEHSRNFAVPKVWKCMECGKVLENVTDLYTRRFCSVDCKDHYFYKL